MIIPKIYLAIIADWLGRRNAMSIECCVFTIGVVIQLASVSAWYQFAIGRFIAGLGVGALSAAVPLYQAETGTFDMTLGSDLRQTILTRHFWVLVYSAKGNPWHLDCHLPALHYSRNSGRLLLRYWNSDNIQCFFLENRCRLRHSKSASKTFDEKLAK